jgi:tRNA A37 threonylcarbamoyladenosine dehydratase
MKSLHATETLDVTAYAPLVFEAGSQATATALEQLIAERRVWLIRDLIHQQLAELVASRTPAEDLTAEKTAELVRQHLGSTPESAFGNWVYYPWSGRLVHVLPESDYRFLRQDRNRYKITTNEQIRLADCCISIAGLSVGMASAATLALEGVGSRYRLADPDCLSLSNLNRLRTGMHNVGVNKAVVAAQELYEIDPYLEIEIFVEGVTDENMDRFLGFRPGEPRSRLSDLLVEECDDLHMKIRLRERARELRIPVIMETSDRGLLDIERFDLEPTRPVLHGALAGTRAERLRELSTKEKVPFVLAIVDAEQASCAALASMIEVKRSISTWPQLASSVALGGAVVTDAARRVLLGTLRKSGRFRVDIDEIVSDERGSDALSPVLLNVPTADEARAARGPIPLPSLSTERVPTREETRYIVAHAVLAPSGGNVQPWTFHAAAGILDCHLDIERAASFLDFQGTASRVALGAAVENATIAAASLGFVTHCHPRRLFATPRIRAIGFVSRSLVRASAPPGDQSTKGKRSAACRRRRGGARGERYQRGSSTSARARHRSASRNWNASRSRRQADLLVKNDARGAGTRAALDTGRSSP